jgi:hypothetical protein
MTWLLESSHLEKCFKSFTELTELMTLVLTEIPALTHGPTGVANKTILPPIPAGKIQVLRFLNTAE